MTSTPYDPSDITDMTLLGKGSFGKVYRAFSKRFNSTVVLKVIDRISADTSLVRHEVAILNHLKSTCDPYLLCYIDFREDGQKYYIITEYLDNFVPLSRENLTIEQIMIVIDNMKKGLQAIHDAGVAHRDLKPENIMINPSTLAVKYIDFGLSCMGVRCNFSRKIGSPLYMSPEGYLIETCYDLNHPHDLASWIAADYWSFGLILLEFATGYHFYVWYIQENGTCSNLEEPSDLLVLMALLTFNPRRMTTLVEEFCHQHLVDKYEFMEYIIANVSNLLVVSPKKRKLIM